MVIKVHNPKHSVGKNAGSVSNLVDYLDKENVGKSIDEMDEFFNHDGFFHTAAEVEKAIDNNKGKLASDETKFYMITVNPSQAELEHLMEKHKFNESGVTNYETEGKDYIHDMMYDEARNYETAFKEYIKDLMDEYAKNFNRQYKDGRSLTGNDIMYFAKIEHERTYKHGEKRFEKEMQHNKTIQKKVYIAKRDIDTIADPILKNEKLSEIKKLEKEYIRNSEGTIIKEGAKKDGNNLHAHIIISRMDKSQTMKLSPMANHKQSKNKLDGKEVSIGFNRDAFVASGEKLFDKKFEYERPPEYQYNYYKEAKQIRALSNVLHLRNPQAFAKMAVKRAMHEMIKDKTLQKQLGYVMKDPRKIPRQTLQKLETKAIESVVKAMGAGAYTNPVTAGVQVAKQVITTTAKVVSKGMGI
ncbi:MobB family relaxase [Flagellimonas sp.]|uniref:MobB family relaxase n=1 Tax=Flagellimonas sp. TaxID=2058762 RepID=UPI003BABAFCB